MRQNLFDKSPSSPVTLLHGVGPSRAAALEKLGIRTLSDLAYHFPRAYENRGNVKSLLTVSDGEVCSLVLTVSAPPKNAYVRRGMTITKVSAFDGDRDCAITYYNMPFVRDALIQGETYRFYGKVSKSGRKCQLTNPVFELWREDMPMRDFVPVYPLTDGISQKVMATLVKGALDVVLSSADSCDILPLEIKKKYSLCDISYALQGIHFPADSAMVEKARRRLAFDEFYLFVCSSLYSGASKKRSVGVRIDASFANELIDKLPYELTVAQRRSIGEICADMSSGYKMTRLLNGDVGSGKTVCAACAVYSAVRSGYQAAVMAPTEILATQHYHDFCELFGPLGVECLLLVGSLTAAKKMKIREKISSGEPAVVIGTHALIEDSVESTRFAVAVIDEQHRFGAAQREKLASKSEQCHILSMSATPIPRTLALALYGNMDVSVLDTMPPGRKKVDTYVVDESYRDRLDKFIIKNVNDGGQVYIVCPSIEPSETIESESGDTFSLDDLELFMPKPQKPQLKAAEPYAAELASRLGGITVGLIHGKMKSAEKDRVMNDFVSGKLSVLVSTTVIEVGVNVPNASLMMIENAEMFGLSTLHQLRGRVGRGERKSYCVLVCGGNSAETNGRLDIMKKTNDGYEIAQRDLEMRGPGDFMAELDGKIRQSGAVDFKLAALVGDGTLLYSATDAAHMTVDRDPALELPEHAVLRRAVTDGRKASAIS
ncbi:MAG: ATP-dependent DNA helicase RecG [Clostridia bacterium]|nr:ATP-dependent DNA helicase RecG [Clostridia bacterium]